jgi:hypothetical protein
MSASAAQQESLALARREAEIAQRIEDYNKRPLKTQITPSTRGVAYAMYYTALQKRIEQTGTQYFPQSQGKKMYGELAAKTACGKSSPALLLRATISSRPVLTEVRNDGQARSVCGHR